VHEKSRHCTDVLIHERTDVGEGTSLLSLLVLPTRRSTPHCVLEEPQQFLWISLKNNTRPMALDDVVGKRIFFGAFNNKRPFAIDPVLARYSEGCMQAESRIRRLDLVLLVYEANCNTREMLLTRANDDAASVRRVQSSAALHVPMLILRCFDPSTCTLNTTATTTDTIGCIVTSIGPSRE
jgi:hypothetical protein